MYYRPGRDPHGLRHNPYKACIAPRPIGWVGTVDAQGVPNLAPFSFFNGASEAPPVVFFSAYGPKPGITEAKDTLANVLATGEFTVSIVSEALFDAMNITSGGYPGDVDEFEKAGLVRGESREIAAPFVAESPVAFECRFLTRTELPSPDPEYTNGAVFGEVVGVHIRDEFVVDGILDLSLYRPVARLGYKDYTSVNHMFSAKRPENRPMSQAMIGVIGGSGVYAIDGLQGAAWSRVDTPWGEASDEVLTGSLNGVPMAFLPRHGRGHKVSPTDINYRANIDALKRIGCTDILSVSACGSFREEMAPGDFVIVDQFIDRTFAREKSFFGAGCVGHVSVAHPTCARLGDALAEAAAGAGVTAHRGGTYLVMEGPQFSTLAESRLYREVWGCDVIGMTNMPEAKLAREAELCYATVAMITDYDSWHPEHGEVDVNEIIATLTGNAEKARTLIAEVAPVVGGARETCPCGCDRALEFAIMTAPEARDPTLVARLDAIAGRVLGAAD